MAGDTLVTVAQMDNDIRVDQERQMLKPRTVRKFKRITFLNGRRLGQLFQLVQHVQQSFLLGNGIAERADGDGIAGLFQRDLYIGRNGKALWQANGNAVAGLEGLGVDGVVHAEVYTGYTDDMQGRATAQSS